MNSELNTKERLLEAAHSLFAERGYHNATVRDIAARARTNLASINYYFRSKDDLYREVMHRSYRKIVETAQVGAETICERGTSPEEKLRLFVRGLIPTTEAGAEEDQHTRLVAWELLAPTGAIEAIEEIEIKPHLEAAEDVVRTFLAPETPAPDITAAALWLVGQCMIFRRVAERSRHGFRPLAFSPEKADHLVDFVTELALAGLRRRQPG